jgi:hypothetical protein
MTDEEISSKLRYINIELDDLRLDIIDVREKLGVIAKVDFDIDERIKLNLKEFRNRKSTIWEIIRTVGLTVLIVIFMIYISIAYIKIGKKIDDFGTPVVVRGSQYVPLPPDARIKFYPKDFTGDTTK